MNGNFNFLFINPPTSKLKLEDYYTSSQSFPINAHFEFAHQDALNYLETLNATTFPTSILLDEAFGHHQNSNFIEQYRNKFYLYHMDTLLFITSSNGKKAIHHLAYPRIVSGILQKPFNKQQFMQEVFPHLKVYLV